ncbi:hypothetical protein GS935_23950 [Rhodococcus hoagii]|nr:hypothetical protein [Prescottella equi]
MQGAGAVLQSDFELVVDDSHGRFGVDTFGAGLLGIESLQRGARIDEIPSLGG